MNNSVHTFIIDIYQIQIINKDYETLDMVKKIIRNIMINENILKIFHDSRHDSLALHLFMNTCIVNVFDTSAAETYRNQLATYQ